MRGGERVLSQVCRMFPGADLHTLIHVKGKGDAVIEGMRIRESVLSRLPGVGGYYRWLLPFMPAVVGRMDLRDYELVLSLSHCVAKGVRVDPRAAHVCYCFTPMRYVWVDVGDEGRGGVGEWGLRMLAPWLRAWDRGTAAGVDQFMANSANVARRIMSCYGREAEVVYSPVDTEFYTPDCTVGREDWYLVVSALTPYKRVEDAVIACGETGRKLKVIGSGPGLEGIRKLAGGYNGIEVLGWRTDEEVREAYRRCRGLLMPQEEDFGLVPLEANACGAAVVAYGAGGALETVVDGVTGVLYSGQNSENLAKAIVRFEVGGIGGDVGKLVAWSGRFGVEKFRGGYGEVVREALALKGRNLWC